MKKIGFLGCGNMGGALAKAAIKSVGAENIFVFDVDSKKIRDFADETDVNIADAEYIVLNCDYIFCGICNCELLLKFGRSTANYKLF